MYRSRRRSVLLGAVLTLSGAQDGFTITVSAARAQAMAQDARQSQSVVAVRAGEQLTERQLLEALLISSGNNIAEILTTQLAGAQTRFVAEMNTQARTLGMDETTYTDPSGFDPSTVSTAADQSRVLPAAMRFPVFRRIVSMASVTLPVAGTLTNLDPLIAEGYAGKTGSDSAAEGCLAFFTHVTVSGRRLTAVGVVTGQGQAATRRRSSPPRATPRSRSSSPPPPRRNEHERRADRGGWPWRSRRRRSSPLTAAARSRFPLGAALMSTRSRPTEKT